MVLVHTLVLGWHVVANILETSAGHIPNSVSTCEVAGLSHGAAKEVLGLDVPPDEMALKLLQKNSVLKAPEATIQHNVLQAPLARFEQCWEAGSDLASRDAACKGDLKCARAGFDGRTFGDCVGHCCSEEPVMSAVLPKNHTTRREEQKPFLGQYESCWDAGPDKESRDAACEGELKCARAGFDGRNFGDCLSHCCSKDLGETIVSRAEALPQSHVTRGKMQKPLLARYALCWDAGSDKESRDAACQGDLKCARLGYELRFFGDCVVHCCSKEPVETSASKSTALQSSDANEETTPQQILPRYAMCWGAGSDKDSRDAACEGDLKCARAGFDGRGFGDCGIEHCCSQEDLTLTNWKEFIGDPYLTIFLAIAFFCLICICDPWIQDTFRKDKMDLSLNARASTECALSDNHEIDDR